MSGHSVRGDFSFIDNFEVFDFLESKEVFLEKEVGWF